MKGVRFMFLAPFKGFGGSHQNDVPRGTSSHVWGTFKSSGDAKLERSAPRNSMFHEVNVILGHMGHLERGQVSYPTYE